MNQNLLLIDDDEDDFLFFKEALKELNLGYQVHRAINGFEGLKTLSELRPSIPDVIFVDLNMPLMTGFEFLSEVKKLSNYKDVPLIVLTTSSESEAKQKALKSGASGFITKPSSIDGLKKIIADVTSELRAS